MAGAALLIAIMVTGALAQCRTTPLARPKPKAVVEATMMSKPLGEITKQLDPRPWAQPKLSPASSMSGRCRWWLPIPATTACAS